MAGNNKDRQRKKNKHNKHEQKVRDKLAHDVATNPLNMMIAMAKKHYRVELLVESIERLDVWASDEEEAQLQVEKGNGRHVGREGPNVVGVKVSEIGVMPKETDAVIDNAETEQDPKVKPLIEVVGS